MIIALLHLADRTLNFDRPARTMLYEAVFPFYISHQTLIVVVGPWCLVAGRGNGAPFAVRPVVTASGCWLLYRGARTVPVLRVAGPAA